MKELYEYREKMIARLAQAAREFCAACDAFENPLTQVEGEWNLHQIASHVRDVEKLVYGDRIRKTLEMENPAFQSFDADSWMETNYNQNESLQAILSEFSSNVDALCQTLKNLPQSAWSRESSHETMGGELALQLWVERGLAHIEEHLQTLKKA